MPLGENELARRGNGAIELRADPAPVRWEWNDLLSSDGHTITCSLTAGAKPVASRTDQQMLEEQLLGDRRAVTTQDVQNYFSAKLRSAAARVIQAADVASLIENDALRAALLEALKSAAKPIAFACGLEMLPPFSVDLRSGSFERQRQAEFERGLVEKEAARQVEHFSRAADLLKQFRQLQSANPDLSASKVLELVGAADRGSLLQSLLMAGAKQKPAWLWAVAGESLVRIDTTQGLDQRTPPRVELFPMPPTLGPLRSVTAAEVEGHRVLLIGAQAGFFLVDSDQPQHALAYADREFESTLGFNRVVYWPQRKQFAATHSEAGLVIWNAGTATGPASTLRPSALGILPPRLPDASHNQSINMSLRAAGGIQGPRNPRPLDDHHLLFTIGGRLMIWDGGAALNLAEPTRAEAVAVVEDERLLHVVFEDGTVAQVDRGQRTMVSAERRFGRVRTAAALPWLGECRLLIAGDDGPVQCVGFEDPLVTQYYSPHRAPRALVGSSAFVAAVSPDRQRVILWNSWDGKHPATEAYIAAVTRHRVADLAIG